MTDVDRVSPSASATDGPERSFARRVFYDVIRTTARLFAYVFLRFRVLDADRTPPDGPLVICCNHQSSLDPVLVGAALPRRLSFLAREELFRKSRFRRWFLEFGGGIPLDRKGNSREGLAGAIERLKAGRAVLIFPEGSRSSDGNMQPLRAGALLLARHSEATLLPVAIAGAYETWPKSRRLPWPTPVRLAVGEPIPHDEYANMSEAEALSELDRRMREQFRRATVSRRRTLGEDIDDREEEDSRP